MTTLTTGSPSTTTSASGIQSYAIPYAQQNLANAWALSQQPYQPYQGQQNAAMTGLQNQAFTNAGNMGVNQNSIQAGNVAGQAAQDLLNTNYNPIQAGYQNVNAPQLNNYSMNAAYGQAANTDAAQLGNSPTSTSAQLGYAPTAQAQNAYATDSNAAQLGYAPTAQAQNAYATNSNAAYGQAAQTGASPYMSAAQFNGPQSVGYNNVSANQVNAPNLNNYSMQAANNISGPSLNSYQMNGPQDVRSQNFNSQSAAQLMNPYLQQSLAPQLALLNQQQGMQATQNAAQATQAGAFGGSRMGIQSALQNQSNQLAQSNLVGNAYNQAYSQAQQQFNTQNAASLQAQQANQQAGLTTGTQNLNAALSTQNLGATLGQQANLANQANQQQANLQNLSANLQTQGLSAQTGLQAQQLNQSAGLQAALANQQAGINTGQFNAQMGYNTGLQNAQLQQQAGLANQSLAGQYGLQNASMQQQTNMANTANQQQANLANQAAQNQFGLSNQAAQNQFSLANQQMAGQYGLQQGQFNQATNLANQAAQNQFGLSNQAAQNQFSLANQQMAGQYGLQQGQFNQATNLANQQMAGQYGLQQGQFNQAANLANQAAQNQFGLSNQAAQNTANQQNLASQLSTQQLGAQQNLAAQQANQNAGLTAQQANINQQQFGAGLGLQGLQSAANAASAQSNIGNTQNAQNQNATVLQNQLGTEQQQYQQGLLNTQYQNYVNQLNYPYQQAAFAQNMINGYPVSSATSTTQPSSPSYLQDLSSLGIGAYGISQLIAKGGLAKVKKYAGVGASLTSSGDSLTSVLEKGIADAQSIGDYPTVQALTNELNNMGGTTAPQAAQTMPSSGAAAAGSYGANPNIGASGLTGGVGQMGISGASGQRSAATPGSTASGSNSLIPQDLQTILQMKKDANKLTSSQQDKLMQELNAPGGLANYFGVDSSAAETDAEPTVPSSAKGGLQSIPLSDSVLPTVSKKRGGITDVARYADDGVTTSGDSLPADIQKADMGDNSLDLGAPSTLNTVRENRGLSAVPVGQVQDVPNQQILQQANAEAQQLRQAQAQPSTPRQMANNMMSNFVQHTPLTAEERISTAGGAPTFDYQSLRDELAKQKVASSDSLRQGRGLAALAAAGAMLEGNQFGRGVGQAATAFGSSYGNALSTNQKAQENLVAMNMKLSQAEHADKLGLYKTKVEAVNAAQKDAQEFDKNSATLFKDMYTADKQNQIKAPEQALAAINAYKANPTPDNKKLYDAAVEYLNLSHPAVLAANVAATQSGTNTNANISAGNDKLLMGELSKASDDAAKKFGDMQIIGGKNYKALLDAAGGDEEQARETYITNAVTAKQNAMNKVGAPLKTTPPPATSAPAAGIPAPAANAPKLLPVPKNPSPKNLVKNGIYPTPNGNMQWTGSGFIPYTGSIAQ